MSICLEKNESVSLTKTVPGLKEIKIGLGWNPAQVSPPFDLDVSAFVCKYVNGEPVLLSDKHFVFFNNKQTPSGSLVHGGDNLTGQGEGDDEVLYGFIDKLNTYDPEAEEVSFIVNIYDARNRHQTFGNVTGCYIRIVDSSNNVEIARYDLAQFNNEITVQFGSLYKADGEWHFKAIGAGFDVELKDFLAKYKG